MRTSGTAERYPWREFWVLLVAGVLASIAALPYALALTPRVLERAPLPVLVVSAAVNSGLLLAIAIGLGLFAARRVGLGAPIVEALLARRPWGAVVRELQLPMAIGLGLGAAAVVVALDLVLFRSAIAQLAAAATAPARWQGFLAALSGGIYEELLLRLGLMSILAWIFGHVLRGSDGGAAPLALWLAILASGILFGLAHLPLTSALVSLSPVLIGRAVLLNGVPGVVFGWLYWRRGLEAAMVAHFSGDLVLHVFIGS